jgi:hypothetical protein
MLGAVVTFIFSLYSVLASYQASVWYTIVFFCGASVAAISFVVSWITLFYGAVAGSIYVVAKYSAEHMRIESDDDDRNGGGGGRQRVHFD